MCDLQNESGLQPFPYSVFQTTWGLILNIGKLKPIFKHHVNLMIQNMDFSSYDNDFKQLCAKGLMQDLATIYALWNSNSGH